MYAFACFVLFGALVVLGFNVLKPSGLVGNRRTLALLLFLGTLLGGVVLVDTLRTPKDDAEAATDQAASRDTYADVERRPEAYLTMTKKFTNSAGVLSIAGTLSNAASYPIKNAKLKCQITSETDVVLSKKKLIVMKVVPAKGSARFGPLVVGAMGEQVAGVGCYVVDAEIASGELPALR